MSFFGILLSLFCLSSAVVAEGVFLISSNCIEQLVKKNSKEALGAKGSVKCYYDYLEAELKNIFQNAKNYCLTYGVYPEIHDETEKFIQWLSDFNPTNYKERLCNFQLLMKNNGLYVKEWIIIRCAQQDLPEEICNGLALAILDLLDAEGKNNILFLGEQGEVSLPNFDILVTISQRKIVVQILPVSFFKTVPVIDNQNSHDPNKNKRFIKKHKKIIVKKYNSASLRNSDRCFSSRDKYFIIVMGMGLMIVFMGTWFERLTSE